MALKKVKPVSPGRRFQEYSTFEEITRTTPEKRLLKVLKKSGGRKVYLAECYWHLGNMKMAQGVLRKAGAGSDRTRNATIIRLCAEMGNLKVALMLAERKAKNGMADIAYISAGNACRRAGQFKKAAQYYEKALAVKKGGRDIKRNKKRAKAALEAMKVCQGSDIKRLSDGTYKGSSRGFRDDVTVEVKVKKGRIVSFRVLRHKEDQTLSAITDIPERIIKKQGIVGVDAVSGATITSDAILNACAKALSK